MPYTYSKADGALVTDLPPTRMREHIPSAAVSLVLDQGQEVKAVGVIYGLEHTVSGPGYEARLLLDAYNLRIKYLWYQAEDYDAMVLRVRWLAEANGFDKIVAMSTKHDWQEFLRRGYLLEAVIRHYHRGEDAYVVSKFRSQGRLTSSSLMEETLAIERVTAEPIHGQTRPLPCDHEVRLAQPADIPELLDLYKGIFASYPSPLIHESYLRAIFGTDSVFAVCCAQGRVVAAASAELHHEAIAAELTDCATRVESRGLGLMTHLLRLLEGVLVAKGYVCAYTMARARSFGMNMVFHQLGYTFMGRLVNNCDIYGAFEDMNIWVRRLQQAEEAAAAGELDRVPEAPPGTQG